MRRLRLATALALALAAIVPAGCSQVAALAPVGGNGLAEVRFGTIDVLRENGIGLMHAPVCTVVGSGPEVTCSGTTLDGTAIEAQSSTAADPRLEVTVGGATLFSGSLRDVLERAARA